MGYVDKHICKVPNYGWITEEDANKLIISGQFSEYWECPVEGCYRLWERKFNYEWIKTLTSSPTPPVTWLDLWVHWIKENIFYAHRKSPLRMEKVWGKTYNGWKLVKPDKRVLIEMRDGTVKEVV
jgi:hypothetical protein